MFLSGFYDWPKPKSKQVQMGHWSWRSATKLSIVPKVWSATLLPIALIKAGIQPCWTSTLSSPIHRDGLAHPLYIVPHVLDTSLCMRHSTPFLISQTSSSWPHGLNAWFLNGRCLSSWVPPHLPESLCPGPLSVQPSSPVSLMVSRRMHLMPHYSILTSCCPVTTISCHLRQALRRV